MVSGGGKNGFHMSGFLLLEIALFLITVLIIQTGNGWIIMLEKRGGLKYKALLKYTIKSYEQ